MTMLKCKVKLYYKHGMLQGKPPVGSRLNMTRPRGRAEPCTVRTLRRPNLELLPLPIYEGRTMWAEPQDKGRLTTFAEPPGGTMWAEPRQKSA